jgi:hypothetical protein
VPYQRYLLHELAADINSGRDEAIDLALEALAPATLHQPGVDSSSDRT